ncbi:MAG: twin-arginine translocase subunit TatC, partial [Persicimonas sp.]
MSVEPEPIPEARQEALDEARMSIIEHLSELRDRLIYIIIAVFIGFVAAWFWREPIFHFLLEPLQSSVSADRADLTQIYYKDLAEPVFAMIKISLLAGIFATSPFSLYQVWKFISPGLYTHEKRMAIPFVILGTFFFFGGAAFCFFGVLPFGYQFLLEFGLEIASEPQLMINEYLGLTTKLLLVFGLIFELPVLAMFLSAMGVIDHNTLLRHW